MSTRDNMKRLICCLTLALIFPVSGIANSPLVPAAPSINADSYLLIDLIRALFWWSTTLIYACRQRV